MAPYPIFFRALKTIIMPNFMLLTESEQLKHMSALLWVSLPTHKSAKLSCNRCKQALYTSSREGRKDVLEARVLFCLLFLSSSETQGRSVGPGEKARQTFSSTAWKHSSRLLTRHDWLPLGLRGWFFVYFKRCCPRVTSQISYFTTIRNLGVHTTAKFAIIDVCIG